MPWTSAYVSHSNIAANTSLTFQCRFHWLIGLNELPLARSLGQLDFNSNRCLLRKVFHGRLESIQNAMQSNLELEIHWITPQFKYLHLFCMFNNVKN